jgi:hypothetical protein
MDEWAHDSRPICFWAAGVTYRQIEEHTKHPKMCRSGHLHIGGAKR